MLFIHITIKAQHDLRGGAHAHEFLAILCSLSVKTVDSC